MYKKILCLSLLAFAPVFAAQVKEAPKKAAIPAKVAVVDFQKIINFENPDDSASLEWRDLTKELEKKLKPRVEDIQKKQMKLQKMAQEAQSKANIDVSTKTQIQQLQIEVENEYKAYQEYSQQALGEVQNQFGEKVRVVVQKVAQEQGWTHVFPGPLLYVLESCDITNDTVKALNDQYRTEQRAKKFSSANPVKA